VAETTMTSSSHGSGVKSDSKLTTAAALKERLDQLKRGRQFLESQWRLNLAFYRGKQYTYYNNATRRIESLPVEDGEKPRYRIRLVNNQIMPGAHSLLSKMTKTKPVMTASPASPSDQDLKAAKMSEKLLEYWWREFDMDDKLEEALLWAIITGQGYWKLSWDPHANKQMRFLLGPDGQPIVDDTIKDLYKAELQKQGVDPQEKVVYLGDIKVEVPSVFDVYLDDTAKVMSECKYMICTHYLTPDEVKANWGADVDADAVASAPDATIPFSNNLNRTNNNVKTVYIGYWIPQPSLPNGRYVVWIDDKILQDEAWPYPFQTLPLVKFPGMRIPGSIYNSSVVEQAIPLQKDLNRTLSQIIEYKNLTVKPRVWVPVGGLSGVRITSEPGAIYEFNPIADMRPEVEQLPSLPSYVFEHLNEIRQSIKDVFGIADVTEGNVPPNVEAGVAIDLLQEMATDRIAPVIKLMEIVLADAGQLMLEFAQKYYIEPRLLKIQGSNGSPQVKRFTQADITGGVNVNVEAGSALPRTRAGRQSRILEYVDRGIIAPDRAWKYLDIGDMEGIAEIFNADEDQVARENERIIAGEILNPVAYDQAEQNLQSGQAMDDQGQPIQPNTPQAQSYLQDQSLQPFPFENLTVHMDRHALFMKSVEFEMLPDDTKQKFVQHWSNTLDYYRKLPPTVQYNAPKTTLQLKGTIGPTGASDILGKSGVYDITPEIMAEPPLETWVSDSIDKPDESAAGNNPLDQIDAQEKLQDIQAKQALMTTQLLSAAQKGIHQENTHQATLDQGNQKMVHAQQLHEQRVQAEKQKVALAAKKTRQSNFKPKPKPKGK
jgi:hypothetical protein